MAQYWCCVNGQEAATLPPNDRGLAYGDGVFETIRINPQPVLLAFHLDRLYEGCRRLAIPLDAGFLETRLAAFLVGKSAGVIKIIVTRGAGGRGYAISNDLQPSIVFSFSELPCYPDSHAISGVNVAIATLCLAHNPRLAGIKHLNRLEQVLARQEAPVDRFPELLLADQQGCLIEGVVSNLFIVEAGVVVTPKLDLAGVAGTLRRWLLDDFQQAGVPVQIDSISMDRFFASDEVFLANSVFGIWPVQACAEQRWQPGLLTRHCQSRIASWFGAASSGVES